MTGITPEGRQAYALLDWANGDPQDRAADASQSMQELARRTMEHGSGQALIEVRDAGTVLRRLASSVSPVALSTISAQVLELGGKFDPLKHPRGAHGKFAKKGTTITEQVAAPAHPATARAVAGPAAYAASAPKPAYGGFAAAIAPAMRGGEAASGPGAFSPHMAAAAFAPRMSLGPVNDLDKMIGELKNRFGTQTPETIAQQVASKADLTEMEQRLKAEADRAEKLGDDLDHEEKEMQRAELAIELGSIGMGVLMGFLTGGPELAAAGLAPFLVSKLIEKGPEIAKAFGNFFISGKGHGRAWVAHPVKKTKLAALAVKPKVTAVPKMIRSRRQRPPKVPSGSTPASSHRPA